VRTINYNGPKVVSAASPGMPRLVLDPNPSQLGKTYEYLKPVQALSRTIVSTSVTMLRRAESHGPAVENGESRRIRRGCFASAVQRAGDRVRLKGLGESFT